MTQESVQGLSAAAMLEVWEKGAGRHPIDQALLLLRHACPEQPFEALCEWPVGRRDAHVLALRRHTIGDRIEAYAECPACRSGLEFELSCATLLALAAPAEAAVWTTVELGGRVYELRGPNSRDLALAAAAADPEEARQAILSRCVRRKPDHGKTEASAQSDEAALAGRLGELDPLAEVLIDLRCGLCGQPWHLLFDIVTFFWNELQARCRRVLQEVDLLARTYGWTEGEILRLSEPRRRLYVEMALA